MILVHEGVDVGRFSVTVELANHQDVANAANGYIPAEQVRRMSILGLVDTGSSRLVIPLSVARALGVPAGEHATVRYADRRTAVRETATDVELNYGGRRGVFTAVVEPDRDSARIGAIVLEDLDYLADCTGQRLVPRDPNFIVAEAE